MADKINVGLVTHADGAHLGQYFESLAKTPEVDGVFVADSDGESFAQAKQVLGEKLRKTYRDYAVMFREAKPSMALVTMEPVATPAVIDAALEAGCHVLAEKPACVSADAFAKLNMKAQMKHRHLMLALANRLAPGVQEARRLMNAGTFGKIYGVEMHLVADQTRLKDPKYHQTWRAIPSRGAGGHLSWLGIHWLDLCHFITGMKTRDVMCQTAVVGGQPIEAEDSAVAVLKFDSGALGSMTSGYYLDKGYHSNLRVWGEHGWFRIAVTEESPLEWYSTRQGPSSKVQKFEYPKGTRGYGPFVRAAVRASADLEEPPITGDDGLLVLQTIFACYRSAKSGRLESVA